MTLRLKRRASRIFLMNEGRKSQIVLLDDRRLDIIIQPKLNSSDLLDLVASHFKLKEKHYFGIGFFDETNHFNWLQGEKKVLDHDFPRKTGLLVLHFAIRFYVDTIGLLRDTQTVELFYLNARQALFRGQIVCDSETVFELAAHVLQATNGDFTTEEETREELKKLPVIPTGTLKEHPSIGYCEDRVICFYEKLHGTSRGLAIVNYMTIVEKLPTYGIHYYDVKDKKDIPWWLGISPKGIAVYDRKDKTTPRKLFTWKNLENLYYRDKKFSIEVHGPKREESGSQVSVSRRTFGASNVDVHAWFAGCPQLTKCIWSMAVAQHQFYLDRKQSKSHLPAARSMSEIAADLCRSTTSLPGSLGSDLSRSPSSHSLPSLSNSRYDLTIEQSDSLKAERDMFQALKARKEALEEALRRKKEELKKLCLQEGELTGELPKDIPLEPGEQAPVFRRRVGTAFSLSVKNVQDTDQLSTDLSKLELEVELQGKITSAAHRLASDKTVSKYVRKQRRQSYTRAQGKLKDMEKKLGDMRKQAGKSPSSSGQPSRPYQESVRATTTGKPPPSQRQGQGQASVGQEEQGHRSALSPSHSSPQLSATYGPNGNFLGRRVHKYPAALGERKPGEADSSSEGGPGTLHNMSANLRLDGSHDSGFSSANNMYNVHSQRTSHYESTDQLRSPATSEPGVLSPLQSQLNQDSNQQYRAPVGGKYVSTDEPFQRRAGPPPTAGHLHYGSLDRKRRDYRQEVYRDVSPVRYKTRQFGGPGGDLGSHIEERPGFEEQQARGFTTEGVRGYGEEVSPAHVMVEVPVLHERGQSLPATSVTSAARQAWVDGRAQTPDQDRLRQGVSGLGPPSPAAGFSADHVYSPRMYEGSGPHIYQEVDVSHVHHQPGPRDISEGGGLSGAHHTASQPVFLRTERSMSPMRSTGHLSHRPAGGLERAASSLSQQQHPHHQFQRATSPGHPPTAQSTNYFPDNAPRSIPIQRVDSTSSAHTPPPSSPLSQYPPLSHGGGGAGSPLSSGPSSPMSHASSTLVTVTRLQPHTEMSKPYEISDFYRYSEKLRRQRIIDQYQRELIGAHNLSRSSSPQSVDSESQHSSHSGSAASSSQHSSVHPAMTPQPSSPSAMGFASLKPGASPSPSPSPSPRGPIQHYGRSSSAPLTSSLPPHHPHTHSQSSLLHHPHHPHHHHPLHHYQPHVSSASSSSSSTAAGGGVSHFDQSPSPAYPDGQMSSSSSSYTVKSSSSQGANVHYAVQSSYKVQQVHSSAKHCMYQPPQPMTCKPVVRNPPSNLPDNHRR